MFLDGDWKIYCFLAFGYLLRDLYFFGNIVLSIGGRLQLGRFCKGSSTSLAWMYLYQGVFISINVIYDLILLFSVDFSFFSWCSKSNMVDVHCAGKRAQIVLHRSFLKSSQIDQDNIDYHHQGIYKVFQVRSTCCCIFSRSQSIGIFIFISKP